MILDCLICEWHILDDPPGSLIEKALSDLYCPKAQPPVLLVGFAGT